MDILNFISWIKGGRIVNTVNQVKTLIPLGVKDNKRDDGYIACAISVEDLVAQIGGGLGGTQYVFVAADGTDIENAAELQAAYVTAQGMSPSATNRITVIAAPGNYNFDSASFVMDTSYIDLVSLDGNKSIVFNGSNTIEITTNDVFVRGVDVGTLNFTIADSLNLLRVENCSGGDYSFGSGSIITSSSTFTNCTGGNFSFGGNGIASGTFTDCSGLDRVFGGGGTADGTFTDCSGRDDSFGGNAGTANGKFTNCSGGDESFGGQGTANGTFTNCSGGDESFGAYNLASGTFTDCTGGIKAFGGGGTASGVFTNCTGVGGAFGGNGAAYGVFTNCSGGDESFGGAGGTASGVFTDCTGGDAAFGGNIGLASGVFNSCIGGNYSFGGSGGTLDGFLYYCRLTSGSFETVSGAGVTRLCIDGSNVENNQG